MRIFAGLIVSTLLLGAIGCGSSIHDQYGPGAIDPGLYKDAVLDNQQRLAGEDRLLRPIYRSPMQAISYGFDKAVSQPISRAFDYFSHDTPATAARKMLDQNSADSRRDGTLRLVNFEFARQGPSLKLYAHEAADPDYTVRAAGLRALNRSRARDQTAVMIRSLEDDQALVRLEAADALGNVPDPAAIQPLLEHLQNDLYRDVRIACAEALRNYSNAEVTHSLVDMLGDKDFSVAWQSRQSLALLTGQDFRYDQRAWLAYISTAKLSG
ncbi:MAG: HEAT repeat domain-containing protein [Planctomycetota bacterium]|nr:HEAT repeat domain-containing protein [Planctomycetota bacterium]